MRTWNKKTGARGLARARLTMGPLPRGKDHPDLMFLNLEFPGFLFARYWKKCNGDSVFLALKKFCQWHASIRVFRILEQLILRTLACYRNITPSQSKRVVWKGDLRVTTVHKMPRQKGLPNQPCCTESGSGRALLDSPRDTWLECNLLLFTQSRSGVPPPGKGRVLSKPAPCPAQTAMKNPLGDGDPHLPRFFSCVSQGKLGDPVVSPLEKWRLEPVSSR